MSKDDRLDVTKKDIVAVIAIMVLMLGSLVYGYFLLKHEPKQPPMTCWDKYKNSSEQIAIQACEVHTGE
jgi:hypothetical protein